MKIKLLILILVSFTLNSCIDTVLGEQYVKSAKYAQRDFENCYQIKGLLNHYPQKVSHKNALHMLSFVPSHLKYEKNSFKAEHYFITSMGDNAEEFYPDTFIYKTNYGEDNFIIDVSFAFYTQIDSLTLRNIAKPNIYPVPYFEDFDFGLGDTELKYWYKPDLQMVANKYNIPKELEIFVLQAGAGDFWKIKCDCERPETLKEWKNGYTAGVAISKESNLAVYWMTAW